MKIVIVNKADLSVASHYDADAPQQSNYGGPWGDPKQFAHVAVPNEIDARAVKAVLVPQQGEIGDIDYQEESVNLEVDPDKMPAIREEKLKKIRELREPRLARVDQLVNVAVLEAWAAPEREALRDYRLALLNVTEVYKANMTLLDAINPSDVVFPEEP